MCDRYEMDPEAVLVDRIHNRLLGACGVVSVEAKVSGSALQVVVHAEHNMCDRISKDLYNAMIGRILQEVIDESDGELSVEYAKTSIVDADTEE